MSPISVTDYIMELVENMPKIWDRVTVYDEKHDPTITGVILEVNKIESTWQYKVAVEERIIDPTALGAMNQVRSALFHAQAQAAAQGLTGGVVQPGVTVNDNSVELFWDFQICKVIGKMSIEEALMNPNSVVRELAVVKVREQEERQRAIEKMFE